MAEALPGNEADLERPLSQLRAVLIPGEALEACALQLRLFALTHRRLLIAATRRLIVLRRGSSAATASAIRWQDLEEVTLPSGCERRSGAARRQATDLTSWALGRIGWSSPGSPGAAQAVYRICRCRTDSARSAACVNSREAARSGGDQVSTRAGARRRRASWTRCGGCGRPSGSWDARLITDAEYEAIKAKIFATCALSHR
jgi:hypothetical protein